MTPTIKMTHRPTAFDGRYTRAFGRAVVMTCLAAIGISHIAASAAENSVQVAAKSSGIDLRNWKLTLPDAKTTEISPAQLLAGFHNQYFSVEANGTLLFTAASDGGSTANSKYPRSELRELLNPDDRTQNWTSQGSHTMHVREAVVQIPQGVAVIVSQIHGVTQSGKNAAPLVKLQWKDEKLQMLVKELAKGGPDIRYDIPGNFQLGTAFDVSLQIHDGRLSMRVNDQLLVDDFVARDPAWADLRFYFKAGNYLQNTGIGDKRNESIVRIYTLDVRHD